MKTADSDRPFSQGILAQLESDRAAATERSLAEYLRLFPNDEIGVAEAFIAFRRQTAPESANDRIGDFTLLRHLGSGGQASVFLARDRRTQRLVALKVVQNSRRRTARDIMRMRREAEALARLNDPGVCALYELGTSGTDLFIAMQYVEGRSLREQLAAEGTPHENGANSAPSEFVSFASMVEPKPATANVVPVVASRPVRTNVEIRTWLVFFERLCRSLHAAHESGIIHGDLKPGNIMFAADGRPIIIDFGLVRGDAPEDAQSIGELVAGTPAYMAPEQFRNDPAVRIDRRIDVFAVGVVMYEAILRERPFIGSTVDQLRRSILETEPERPSRLNANLPRDVEIVLLTALAKDASRRYATAELLANDLSAILEHRPISARRPSLIYVTVKAIKRNATVSALIAVFFFVVVAYTIALSKKARESADNALDASKKAAEANENLARYTQLSGAKLVAQLLERADTDLWPAWPETIPALDAWLRDAEAVTDRKPDYVAAFEALKRQASPIVGPAVQREKAERARIYRQEHEAIDQVRRSIASLQAKSTLGESDSEGIGDKIDDLADELAKLSAKEAALPRVVYEFEDATSAWRYDVLRELIADVAHLEAVVAEVRNRRVTAIPNGAACVDDELWSTCIADVSADPRFRGFELTPQYDLRPLAKNPATGLWEFWHVGSGTRPTTRDGKIEIREETALVFVLAPGGLSRIGCKRSPESGQVEPHSSPYARKDEAPVHDVPLEPYFISKFEMTQAQWVAITGENPSVYQRATGRFESATLTHPVESVSWNRAVQVLRRLGITLPTEAQWEHACRAGSTTDFTFGDAIEDLRGRVNLADQTYRNSGGPGAVAPWEDGFIVHAPVDRFEPNRFGLFNVHGNVSELCLDSYAEYTQPTAPGTGERIVGAATDDRLIRGGSFGEIGTLVRASQRYVQARASSQGSVGLRPARSVFRLRR